MPNSKIDSSGLSPYIFSLIYCNGTLLVGHPAERLKVAAQLDLGTRSYNCMRPLITGDFKNLYTGFPTCAFRQNTKYLYRTLIMSTMPGYVDLFNFNIFFGSALKAAFAAGIDTAITTPFENVKTTQMQSHPNKLTISQAMDVILKERGLRGFFAGANVSATKSFPSWYYLFLGYEATKDKREKQNFLSTIFWATILAIPITAATNPLDVIKTQQQANLIPKDKGILNSAKYLIEQHGIFSLSRGFTCRLLHKSLAMAAGHTLIDLSSKLNPGRPR